MILKIGSLPVLEPDKQDTPVSPACLDLTSVCLTRECHHDQHSSQGSSGLNSGPVVFRASISPIELRPCPSSPVFVRSLFGCAGAFRVWILTPSHACGLKYFLLSGAVSSCSSFPLLGRRLLVQHNPSSHLVLFHHPCPRAHILKEIFAAGCSIACL